ncbi:hypothetical protein KA005_82040, partial [bacterium]|nr:hypothetical protein [bacterium]
FSLRKPGPASGGDKKERVGVRFIEPIPPSEQDSSSHTPESLNFKNARDEFEKDFLTKVLEICGGNISEAARKCGISRRYFHQKITKYRISSKQW